MDLAFRTDAAAHLKSGSQRVRLLSEGWVAAQVACPACGARKLLPYPNNRPVADFACEECDEDFELKSQRLRFGRKLLDGAYGTMMQRLASGRNPNLLLLNDDAIVGTVTDLCVIPKHLFVASMIERRPPLPVSARRAGWIGCRILLSEVPASGRVWMIRAGIAAAPDAVQAAWNSLVFLRGATQRGWLVRTMACIDRFGAQPFTLQDIYAFDGEFAAAFPGNANVRAKIRQQLQVLRDRGQLLFESRGVYRRAPAALAVAAAPAS